MNVFLGHTRKKQVNHKKTILKFSEIQNKIKRKHLQIMSKNHFLQISYEHTVCIFYMAKEERKEKIKRGEVM